MFIIAGLGNPGPELKKTRHNIGFMALDVLAEANSLPSFNLAKKYQALISEGFLGEEKILLLKPRTFMNASGLSVKAALKNFKLGPESLIVIHDDADLPLGALKISEGHGPGGHKGVGSIIQEIKTKDFTRIRIGIAPVSEILQIRKPDLKDFVLKKFTKDEEETLARTFKEAAEAAAVVINSGADAAMNRFN